MGPGLGFFHLENANLYPKINQEIVWLPLFSSPQWCLRSLDYFSISGTIFPENTVGSCYFLKSTAITWPFQVIHWNGPKSPIVCCLVLFSYQQTRSVASYCCNPSVPQMWKKCHKLWKWIAANSILFIHYLQTWLCTILSISELILYQLVSCFGLKSVNDCLKSGALDTQCSIFYSIILFCQRAHAAVFSYFLSV